MVWLVLPESPRQDARTISSLLGRKPKDLPEFRWVNTILGNLKTSLGGSYHAFDFAKYGLCYLGAFVYRFNRRFHLENITIHLLVAAATIAPRPGTWIRQAEVSC